MNESRKVTVTVELAPLDVLLLTAISSHTGQSKAEVVADALRLLFVAIPRPGDTAPLERDHEIEAAKPGGAT